MKVTMRDISTKKWGTRTKVTINKKSTNCSENAFLIVMREFSTNGYIKKK